MIKNYTKFLMFSLMLFSGMVSAQNYIDLVRDDLKIKQIDAADVQDLKIINEIYSSKNDITRVYLSQQINGIPIKNAQVTATFKSGKLIYLSHNLEKNISSRSNISTPSIDVLGAASRAVAQLNLRSANFSILEAQSSQNVILSNGGVSQENVPVRLVYAITEEGDLKLAWDLSIYTKDSNHWWSVRIDALTGSMINKNDWVIACTFEGHNHEILRKDQTENTFDAIFENQLTAAISAPYAGESYNVYAMPLESPNHGNRATVTDPQTAEASPFGWHDTDGVEGAEFTITRGNNVYAQEDLLGNNNQGESPDGGSELTFDFPIDLSADAEGSRDAAITNLFYWNNIVHDVFYNYGFDEASGNFQEINYSGEGAGGDFVIADGFDNVRRSVNNANFGTPPEGNNPRMQMFLWNTTGEDGNLEVIEPAGLARNIELSVSSFVTSDDPPRPNNSFFASLENPDLNAQLVLVEDDDASADSTDPNDGCDTFLNPEELDGNIALIRRGACNFTVKVASAQAAGAIGVIIANNVADEIINLGGTEDNMSVIPAGMINQTDGDALIEALQNGETIIVNATRPRFIDGSLDNGIIIHEYGHGISTRLTGGPNNTNCLDSRSQFEQMGEGWSDYFGLMLTMTASDVAEQGRGIGTFATSQPTDGPGIRPAQYSTDTTINGLTYGDTNDEAAISQPHGIGTVWATILWDMTWDLIELYGFDSDIYNGTGGNNTALQLVMDGLKNQPCLPGFVDGRDAILAAVDMNERWTTDQERRDAKCLVYTAFAERGVGFGASQGSRFSRTDQVEDFTFPEGNDNFCNELSVGGINVANFSVYPNPSNGTMNLRISKSVGAGTVKIFDINGRLVHTQESLLEGNVRVEASNLSTGVYLLQVQSDMTTETIKLIIE